MFESIFNFYITYADYFNIGFFIILFSTIINVGDEVKKVLSYFGDKQFDLSSYYMHDPSTQTSHLILRIHNKNVHDLRLSSFGYQYKNETIDLISIIKKSQSSTQQTIIVQPRDYLELTFDSKPILDTIIKLNESSYKVKKIKAYVTDSMGMTSISDVAFVKAYIQKELNKIKTDIKLNKKRVKKNKKDKNKELRIASRRALKLKLKERWNQFKMWHKKETKS
jgi:hypothetical protein